MKIQHQGLRRTISLRGDTRAAAGLEAQALYNLLLSDGWDAALAAHVGVHASACPGRRMLKHELQRGDDAWPKTDARYWRPRLLHRKHPAPVGRDSVEPVPVWSARIEHDGTSHYFPLGTAGEKAAAAQAAKIYRSMASAGWEATCRRFSRELTLGFHWVANPVAWTYTTLHTQVDEGGSRVSRGKAAAVRIGLVEGERGLQRTLARYLSRHAWVHVFSGAQEALCEIPRRRIDLVLANQVLADMAGAQFAQALKRLAPRLPVVGFSTYEDSDQLFLCAPGGALAYLLKRTPPEHLLAPIERLLAQGALTHEKISEQVRQYFYGASLSLESGEALSRMSLLTPREKQILDCLSKGYVDKEIADELGISAWTVHGHVKNIFEKLDVHSRTAAVVKYLHK